MDTSENSISVVSVFENEPMQENSWEFASRAGNSAYNVQMTDIRYETPDGQTPQSPHSISDLSALQSQF